MRENETTQRVKLQRVDLQRRLRRARIGRIKSVAGATLVDPKLRRSTDFPAWLREGSTRRLLRGKQVGTCPARHPGTHPSVLKPVPIKPHRSLRPRGQCRTGRALVGNTLARVLERGHPRL